MHFALKRRKDKQLKARIIFRTRKKLVFLRKIGFSAQYAEKNQTNVVRLIYIYLNWKNSLATS